MNLETWAIQWGVPFAALADLRERLRLNGNDYMDEKAGASEAAVQAVVRLEASRKGVLLWRNNVGALKDERGVLVRYGLANTSAGENKILKSGDLVGVRPVLIGPQHVGQTIGQFVSREVKEKGWTYKATPREEAQLAWAQLVLSVGGDASFCSGEGTL
jgi:hypothetical protein